MTARPQHLRLVVANDAGRASACRTRRAWSVSELAVAADTVSGTAPEDVDRAALLRAASLAVLASSVTAVPSKGGAPAKPSLAGDGEAPRDPRALWLGREQIGFLEELALLRRERTFVVRGTPSAARLEASPSCGAACVEGLIGGAPIEFGPADRRLWAARAASTLREFGAKAMSVFARVPRSRERVTHSETRTLSKRAPVEEGLLRGVRRDHTPKVPRSASPPRLDPGTIRRAPSIPDLHLRARWRDDHPGPVPIGREASPRVLRLAMTALAAGFAALMRRKLSLF